MTNPMRILVSLARHCNLTASELLDLRHGDFDGATGRLDLSKLNTPSIDLESLGLADAIRSVYMQRSMLLSPELPLVALFTPSIQTPDTFKRYYRRHANASH